MCCHFYKTYQPLKFIEKLTISSLFDKGKQVKSKYRNNTTKELTKANFQNYTIYNNKTKLN